MLVSKLDIGCFRFLWCPRTKHPVQIYGYQRHVFGAKSSATCANYAVKRNDLDNEQLYPIAAIALESNPYMNDFIKSFDSTEEAIEVFSQIHHLSNHGFELNKRISNNDEVFKTISEDVQSTNKMKQVDVKCNKEGSSMLGLQ